MYISGTRYIYNLLLYIPPALVVLVVRLHRSPEAGEPITDADPPRARQSVTVKVVDDVVAAAGQRTASTAGPWSGERPRLLARR